MCVFYTDGLAERANRSDEFFGEERILAVVREQSSAAAADVLSAIVADADRFARGVEPADDTAVLVVRSC